MDRHDTHDTHDTRTQSDRAVGGRCRQRVAAGRSSSIGLAVGLALVVLTSGCSGVIGPWRASIRGARHYAAGSDALDRGDATTAIAELRAAARLVPHASEIRNHLGIAYWQAGALDRAGAAFEEALELDCDNEAARRNLARLDAVREAGSGSRDTLP